MKVALIVARDFAEPDEIRAVVRAAPDGVDFVVRAREAFRDPDAPKPEPGKLPKAVPLIDLLDELGISPEIRQLEEQYKGDWGDHRARVRDEKIKTDCDRVIVFTTPDTKTLGDYVDDEWVFAKLWPNVRVIERGKKAKRKYRKGKAAP